MMLIINSILFI